MHDSTSPDVIEQLRPVAVDLPTGAQLLGIGFSKFRELTDSGQIPTLTVGTRRLVRVAAVDAYATRREAETMAGRAGQCAESDGGFAARVAARRGVS